MDFRQVPNSLICQLNIIFPLLAWTSCIIARFTLHFSMYSSLCYVLRLHLTPSFAVNVFVAHSQLIPSFFNHLLRPSDLSTTLQRPSLPPSNVFLLSV